MPRVSKKPVEYPRWVFASKGWLYFQKVYKGQRYIAPLGLKDNQGGREAASRRGDIQLIIANMNAGIFKANDFPLLKRYHTQGGIDGIPTFEVYAQKWMDMKKAHVAHLHTEHIALLSLILSGFSWITRWTRLTAN